MAGSHACVCVCLCVWWCVWGGHVCVHVRVCGGGTQGPITSIVCVLMIHVCVY